MAARAGQSRSEGRPAVTEITCAQWRAGCFNLVVGMGEASGQRACNCGMQAGPDISRQGRALDVLGVAGDPCLLKLSV